MSKIDLHIEWGQKPGCIVRCVLCTAVSFETDLIINLEFINEVNDY